eukprot:TRINITY_DN30508_c0_g1_i1.p1 TRINITY_DN30508_c0_g1~~TRINITY_DN30508_c0_g1_i1.p1  ORF type:complete len:227 (+),score=48.38 TRINITY_DN30508_c0_g1_i1:69-749(+)
MSVELHLMRLSVHTHGAWMLLKQAGIEHEIKDVDLMKGEQNAPEFLAMNPLHTVPTLKHGKQCVWESNAVVRYIVNTFDSAKKFYPNDLKMRTHCDIALEWKQNTFYKGLMDVIYPIFGFIPKDEDAHNKAMAKFAVDCKDGYLYTFEHYFLNGKPFVCGDKVTIADFVIAPCFEFLDACDEIKLPEAITSYRQRFYKATNYEEMANGMGGFGARQLVEMKRSNKA